MLKVIIVFKLAMVMMVYKYFPASIIGPPIGNRTEDALNPNASKLLRDRGENDGNFRINVLNDTHLNKEDVFEKSKNISESEKSEKTFTENDRTENSLNSSSLPASATLNSSLLQPTLPSFKSIKTDADSLVKSGATDTNIQPTTNEKLNSSSQPKTLEPKMLNINTTTNSSTDVNLNGEDVNPIDIRIPFTRNRTKLTEMTVLPNSTIICNEDCKFTKKLRKLLRDKHGRPGAQT